MGKNGSGKSTLAKVMAGHPSYELTGGDVFLDGRSILDMEPDERARAGLFLAFQYPDGDSGRYDRQFSAGRAASPAARGRGTRRRRLLSATLRENGRAKIPREFTARSVNEGFSGGEKKRCEILQLAMLEPDYAVLDETDSGLDIDALKVVAEGVNALRAPDRGFLVITHYQRLLNHIVPDIVHVMVDGRIVRSGDKDLALKLEAEGYDWVEKEAALAA